MKGLGGDVNLIGARFTIMYCVTIDTHATIDIGLPKLYITKHQSTNTSLGR